jgi:hypothetical protein
MKKSILSMSQIETRIADIFSMAKLCHYSSEYLNLRLNDTVHSELSRTTGKIRKQRVYSDYLKGFASGLIRAHTAQIYAENLEFCYLVDGILYSTHKLSSKPKTEIFYAAENGRVLNDVPNGHYWKNSNSLFYGDTK